MLSHRNFKLDKWHAFDRNFCFNILYRFVAFLPSNRLIVTFNVINLSTSHMMVTVSHTIIPIITLVDTLNI